MSAAQNLPAGWRQFSLRELHAGGIRSIDPRDFPSESFEYYSIPAYQDAASPLVTPGKEIQSQKLLIPGSCLLFGKLNPRVEKVWNVRSSSQLRKAASTEWLPIVPVDELDQDFGHYLLRSDWVMPVAQSLVSGSTPSRERVEPKSFYDIVVPVPDHQEQRNIARVMSRLDDLVKKQGELLQTLVGLKSVAMRELLTRGLRGEAQKETEIGLVPESWEVERLDNRAQVVSTRMAYSELEGAENTQANAVRVVGIKVSDMNRVGNETVLAAAALERLLDASVATYRCAPPGTIVFPKRGAAIATNKKRLTETWSVFDPNVIGVVPNEITDVRFLFQWFQSFDLRTITEPGPTPQLNKKHLDPLPIPVPPTIREQKEIAAILDAIDSKIDLHRQKCAVLEDLFKSLLHKLMTGEIRVADLDLSALQAQAATA